MKPNVTRAVLMLSFIAAACGCASEAARPPSAAAARSSGGGELAGTSWQLVRFQGGDGTTLIPDDGAKYTLSFAKDGIVTARVDCNRGRSTWTSRGASQLEFGVLALTRAACPPGSLHDHIVRQWPYVRSYVLKDGHLFIALMVDGGIYEFGPIGATALGG